jgi:hypothetical protein
MAEAVTCASSTQWNRYNWLDRNGHRVSVHSAVKFFWGDYAYLGRNILGLLGLVVWQSGGRSCIPDKLIGWAAFMRSALRSTVAVRLRAGRIISMGIRMPFCGMAAPCRSWLRGDRKHPERDQRERQGHRIGLKAGNHASHAFLWNGTTMMDLGPSAAPAAKASRSTPPGRSRAGRYAGRFGCIHLEWHDNEGPGHTW